MTLIRRCSYLAALAAAGCLLATPAFGQLYGVAWDTGNLYSVSPANASLTLIGNTGLTRVDSLEFGPDGRLFATTNFSSVGNSQLYTINPATAAATPVGPMGVQQFEGALAFAPDGTAYGAGQNSTDLYTISTATGAATVIGNIGVRDVSGMLFRSDGTLVAMEGTTGDNLYSINLSSFATANISALPSIGGVGGMTAIGNTAYLATGLTSDGTNSLYTIDLFTGATSLIGTFGLSGDGISGLAGRVPEPSSVALLATLIVGLLPARLSRVSRKV
jgi:hypothetical protein